MILIFPAGSSPQNGTGKQDGGPPGVTLMSVTKEYEPHRAAVRDLTLTFHRDQITALLGTNGAGKSTVMWVPFPARSTGPDARTAVYPRGGRPPRSRRVELSVGLGDHGAPAGPATRPWPPAPAGLGRPGGADGV